MKTNCITTLMLIIMSVSFSIAQTAYIPNSLDNTVSVINLATNTVTATISVGTYPYAVSASADGTKVYVTIDTGSTVNVINTATNTISAVIPVGTEPYGVCVSPDGSKVYTANAWVSSVSVINTATNTVSATITVGTGPWNLAVNPSGSKLYVTNYSDGTVSVINTSTNAVIATIPVGTMPMGICVSPNGSKVYVANNSGSSISVINTATNAVTATIPLGSSPIGICVTPDGTKVYVANGSSSFISVINTSTDTVSATIPFDGVPYGMSVNQDGSRVYFTNTINNDLGVINTATNTFIDSIIVGNTPLALGNFVSIYPSTCVAHYTTTYDSTLNTFNLYVDSITSNVATGFHWDFGDGITSTLNAPTHTYAMDTVYNVCMKVYVASGDSCEYCHIIGKDYLGNIYRTTGFNLIVQNASTALVPDLSKETTMTIAPNPFTSQTTITFSELQKKTTIRITDLLGQEIKIINFTGKQLVIDKAEMKAGIYFVQTTDEQKNICNKKIIIQ